MPLRDHLRELRNRLLKAGVVVLAGSVVGWVLYDPVFEALMDPVLRLSRDEGRQATVNFGQIATSFDLKVRVSIWLGVLVSSPMWLYQLWAFITPGLTRKERRYAVGFVFAAAPLFLAGCYLAWLFVPNAVRFLTGFTPEGASNLIDAQYYLGFVMRIVLAFGVAFLLPVLLVGLNLAHLLSGRTVLKAWRWVLVVCFAFAAMATPTPDITAMFMLASPMIALFGVAIGICLLVDRRRARREPAWLDDEASEI